MYWTVPYLRVYTGLRQDRQIWLAICHSGEYTWKGANTPSRANDTPTSLARHWQCD